MMLTINCTLAGHGRRTFRIDCGMHSPAVDGFIGQSIVIVHIPMVPQVICFADHRHQRIMIGGFLSGVADGQIDS